MGIVLLFAVSLIWSLVAVMIKLSSVAVDSFTIAFCRFFFSLLFLGVILHLKDGKISLRWNHRWIWVAAVAKSGNYILEGIAISIGTVYAGVVEWPLQTILLVLVSFFFFKEEVSKRTLAAALLSCVGVLLISWNGLPLSVIIQDGVLVLILYILASVGAACHLTSQKVLIKSMHPVNMNFSVFALSGLMTVLPLPLRMEWHGSLHVPVALLLVALGLVTGVSFYLYAIALKTVSFFTTVIVTNCGLLFTLLWSWLFFNETITVYIVSGALLFLAGVVIMNLRERGRRPADAGASTEPA